MLSAENIDNKIKEFWPKNGGRVLLDQELLNSLIEDIVILKKLGLTPLLVHGGGLGIKKKSDELKIENKFIMGLRVTDSKMIRIVEEVMIQFNKEIVKALEKKSCKAKSITIKENNVIYVEQENKKLGDVGRPKKIQTNILEDIIAKGFVPIITPMGVDFKGQAYNINADVAAGALARSLRSRRLILLTDVDGVLDENNKLISEINTAQTKKLIDDGTIHGGMIPKMKTCINAINNGVRAVVIIDGRKPHSILFELFSDQGAGTLIRK